MVRIQATRSRTFAATIAVVAAMVAAGCQPPAKTEQPDSWAIEMQQARDIQDAGSILVRHRLIRPDLLSDSNKQIECLVTVPDTLFQQIQSSPRADARWNAVYHYASLTDAGASLAFLWACFGALERDPLLFYQRYIAGDDNALVLMQCALASDGSPEGNLSSGVRAHGYENVPAFYAHLKRLYSLPPPPSAAATTQTRHRYFCTQSRAMLDSTAKGELEPPALTGLSHTP